MIRHVICRILNRLGVVLGLIALGVVFSGARLALAQTQAGCPLPDGVAPPADPTVTAQQVEDGSASLRDFALAARERLNVELGDGVYLYNLCLIRQEGGPYRSGSTYLVQLTLDRRVYVHAKQMALSGRRLKPSIFGEILAALGVSPADLGRLRSTDPAIRGPALAALNNTLSQEPEAPFNATASVPGASGHVSSYYSDILGVPIIQFAGFDLNETHLDDEVIDYGDPAITAEDVVDRETLRAFVAEAGEYYLDLFQTDNRATDTKSRLALRDPNGPWRHGSVYLYVLDLNSNTILVHGAFPDRYELRPLVTTVRDAVTGKLILPQIIEVAKSNPEGGFVEYYFDDPADDSDSADIPKVGYARQFKGELPRADGSALSINVIIGSGFYGQEPTIPTLPVGDVTAADVKDRATLRSFVQAAASAYAAAIDEAGFENHDDIVEAFRVDDGTWQDGDVYLYISEPDGTFVFHGVNPSLEGQNLIRFTDLNGVMYVKELLDAAQGGGGFVEYYFDDPTVTGDEELGSPKVGYAELMVADGRELVMGSGIYPDLSDYELEIALSVSPATLTEEGGAQKVTVTATQSSAPIEISSVIDLSLSGTATADDYSVRGDPVIRIPAGATTGSTELTFTVADDTAYESGGETIVVTARSRGVDLDTATVAVTDSYQAPAAVGAPPAVTLEAGDAKTVDAGPLFSGTDLSYSASWTDNGVVEAVMSGATLTVTGVRKGGATVTVAARNAAGEASLAVGVTVTAIAAEREAYTNILAAMGRSMLSGVSATIGGRFAAGGHGQGVVVGGRRIDGLASGVTALAGLTGHGRQAASKEMALLTGPERRRGASGDYLLRTSSFSYALEDHTATGGLRWSVWGAGDLQNFQGEPDVDASYDGDLKSAYLGFDVATGRSWLMGIALSRVTGQSDYDVTVASGSLESRLTAVLPYLRWTCPTGFTEVWSIVGIGAGEAEVEDGTSDLSMRMGMLGARSRLASSGGLGLDLVGDAGLVRLSTSDSESAALRDITTGVQRIRVGLEGSRATALAGGATVTPYAQVAGRYDGGDGQTGQGLEVSGGLRLTGGRVGLDARGRFLAVHTAEGYSENGVSLVAYLRAKADGRGLSMSVAPRMGAGTGDSGMMWRERPLADSALRGGSRARSLQAEVGYGLASSPTGLLLTPFGDLYLDGDERRQVRLGARIGAADLGSRIGSLELSGARIDRRGGASDHRIGLIGRMSF